MMTNLGAVTMGYDGEGNMTSTSDTGTGQNITWIFDAEGQRAQKSIAGGSWTLYIHDAFGQLAAEYNNQGISPACVTRYLSYDMLGSVRMVTDQSENLIARHDYVPFGEEIPNGSAGRVGNFGYPSDVTQGFTGQESDGGTAQLDFFNARHLAAVTGAFVQPDPGNAGADVTNPQSWNAYAYVLGNPLDLTDPSGMSYLGPYGNGDPGDPGDPCDGDPWGDGDCGEGPGWWPIGGGRGGHGGTASGSAPSQLPPVNMPASPYPGGERLGLPPGLTVPWPLLWGLECDFGSCGAGPAGYVDSAPPGVPKWLIDSWIFYLVRWPYADIFDHNHRLFGTHYCGAGGGGVTLGDIDKACQAHDKCYERAGIDANVNRGANVQISLKQAIAIQACNQQLFNAAERHPNQSGSLAIRTWLHFGSYVGVLAPGTAANP